MTNNGVAGWPSTASLVPDGSIAPAKLAAPFWGRLVSGNYYVTASQQTTTTSVFTAGQMRLAPWFVPNACSLSRIGAEVTTIGDVGSKVRLGIYVDNGSAYPGSLVLDAGQISGDSATVQELTVNVALTPGLYWVGGVSQSVSVTAPTLRSTNQAPVMQCMSLGTSTPASSSTVQGYQQGSVTGALPQVFTTTLSNVGGTPRVFVKVA